MRRSRRCARRSALALVALLSVATAVGYVRLLSADLVDEWRGARRDQEADGNDHFDGVQLAACPGADDLLPAVGAESPPVVLVVGGGGLLGFHVARGLRERGADVWALAEPDSLDGLAAERSAQLRRAGVTVFAGDPCRPADLDRALQLANFTQVVQAAGAAGHPYVVARGPTSAEQDAGAVTQVIECGDRLLLAMRERRPAARLILLSTLDVYSPPRDGQHRALHERDDTTAPQSWLGALASLAEEAASAEHAARGMPLSLVRLAAFLGPLDGPEGMLGALVVASTASADDAISIQVADWMPTADYIVIDDAVAAIAKALHDRRTCGIVNVGTGVLLTPWGLAERLHRAIAQRGVAIVPLAGPVDDTGREVIEWTVDVKRTTKLLGGWKPSTALEDALRDYVQWRWPQATEPPKPMARRDVILACYFTTKEDPQRGRKMNPDRFNYISRWYKSLVDLGLSGVVFHDNLSFEFVGRHRNDAIEFEHVTLGNRSTNDERFFIYYEWLRRHPEVERVFMTDISDVRFMRSPFELMDVVGNDRVYIGSDAEIFSTMGDIDWLKPRLKMCFGRTSYFYGEVHRMLGRSMVYNAGIVGGSRGMMMRFLARLTEHLDATPVKHNCNMPVFNFVLHRYFEEDIFTGFPLNSRFMARQPNPKGVYIVHK